MKNHELNTEQIQQYQSSGYLLLKNALPADLLRSLCQVADELEEKALTEHAQAVETQNYFVTDDPVGPQLIRYSNIYTLHPDAILDLLACPAMMAISKQLCGPGVVPTKTDILYKQQHPHPAIGWHQDTQHSRRHPYLNIGIYLDDAPSGDGCVRYLPNTQDALQDIQGLSEEHGWELPGVVEQPAQAGDFLIHDMMVLHGSPPKRSAGTRRTIYVELRPIEGIRDSAKQSDHWGELRRQLMALVLERAGDFPAQWSEHYPVGEVDQETLITEIAEKPESPAPSIWATFPVDHPDYPVPADLRDKVSF